jgi:hypothetical protein
MTLNGFVLRWFAEGDAGAMCVAGDFLRDYENAFSGPNVSRM